MAKNRRRANAIPTPRSPRKPIPAPSLLALAHRAPKPAPEAPVSLDDDWGFKIFIRKEIQTGLTPLRVEAIFYSLEERGPADLCCGCARPGMSFGIKDEDITLTLAFMPPGSTNLVPFCPACLPCFVSGPGVTQIQRLAAPVDGCEDDGAGDWED